MLPADAHSLCRYDAGLAGDDDLDTLRVVGLLEGGLRGLQVERVDDLHGLDAARLHDGLEGYLGRRLAEYGFAGRRVGLVARHAGGPVVEDDDGDVGLVVY